MNWDLPLRRLPDIELQPVTDGYVASLPGGDRVHFLNPTAALILESCDGTLPAGRLPRLVADAFGLAEPPFADVEACLESLLDQGLVREVRAG
ncbi:MAG: PqqD family protein [Proteobacteria bacterium]|nr:PqqD family protein [Pseudomonadota bacterium]